MASTASGRVSMTRSGKFARLLANRVQAASGRLLNDGRFAWQEVVRTAPDEGRALESRTQAEILAVIPGLTVESR